MIYNPGNIFVERLRLAFQRRVQDAQVAYLGDSDAPGARVEIPDKSGYVYARFAGTPDENGSLTYSTPFPVRSAGVAFLNAPGAPVYVAYGRNNELQIVEAHFAALDKAGIDTRVFNPLHQQNQWVYLWQLTIGLCSAVANSVNSSFLVTVKKFRHYTGNVFATFETGDQASKIDLSGYIPTTDEHCYAAVWVDTYTNTAVVTTSTAQSLFTPLDETDIQELVEGRPADGIPHKAFYLSNDQGTVTQQAAADVDLRQFLNMPPIWGFPTTLTTKERVRPGYTLLVPPYTASGSGALTVEAGGAKIEVGNTDGTLAANSDSIVPTQKAIKTYVDAGSSGMTSFDITADSGGTTTVADGDTIDYDGGSGIDTSLSGLMLSFAVDSTVIRTTGTQAIAAGLTITSPTLVTPTIASFTNAQHSHQNAAGGGTLDAAALASGTLNNARVNFAAPGDIGTTTPAKGWFSELKLKIGGFFGTFFHAITADRTWTFPDASGTVALTTTVAPVNATYIVETADSQLTNEFALGSLATGILKNTTTTGVPTIAAAGTDYTSPTGTENVSNKTITASSLIATALSLLIGGFKAIFTHAFTADRTVTIPGDANVTLVGLATTQTLTGKTIDGDDNTLQDIPLTAIKTNASNTKRLISRDGSGVITDAASPAFDNAQHNHQNAAGGGQLTDAALSAAVGIAKGGTGQTAQTAAFNALSPQTTKGDLIARDSTNDVRVAAGTDGYSLNADSTATPGVAYAQRLARAYRQDSGFILRKLDNATLYVTPGMVEVNGSLVEVTTKTKLGMATNGDWIGGASNEAASAFAYVYIDASGNIKLHNKAPNVPTPAAAIATMLVNQSTWDGTSTKGLNATATIYDNDTGEGSVTEGMLALIYASTDSDYSLGRGRGSAAAGSNNDVSAALVTAISTGGAGGTITFEAGHNIAIRDNDRIAVVPYGSLIYRQESGTWYRLLGMMYNNASSNLEENRHDNLAYYNPNEGSNYTTTSTSMTAVDATNLSLTILSTGLPAMVSFAGSLSSSSGIIALDVFLDGIANGGDNGYLATGAAAPTYSFNRLLNAILPGTHTVVLDWRISAGTATMYAGAGTSNQDVHPQFSFCELGVNH